MKATRHETWGVHLGFSVPMFGGYLFLFPDGRIEWDWGYATDDAGHVHQSPREYLEAR